MFRRYASSSRRAERTAMLLHWVGKRANYEQRNELDLNTTGERIMVHRCCSGSLEKPRPLREEASKINAH